MLVDKKGRPLIIQYGKGKGKIRRFTVEDLVSMGRNGFDTFLSFKWIKPKK